jgi:uncharacterized protein YndB with AHSA1/START domain
MPVIDLTSDAATRTITVVAEYPVSVERLWEAYSDPRQLERFWGPAEWPATFTRHDMAVGGESHYVMTGPDGTQSRGAFRFLRVDPLRAFEMEDFFVGEDGARNDALPSMRMVFTFEATPAGSRFTSVTHFPSVEAMEQLVAMGMLEGTRSAMSQIDTVLADLSTFAATLPTMAQHLSDTQVRVSRVIRGPIAEVWRAHREPALMQQWLKGPDGWSMPVCEIAARVGDTYRYEWVKDDGSERFGFTGELLESQSPFREVTTERMLGTDGPATRNELSLVAVPGGTLLILLITYPSRELRDMILGTGMVDGMDTSYGRLERLLPAA